MGTLGYSPVGGRVGKPWALQAEQVLCNLDLVTEITTTAVSSLLKLQLQIVQGWIKLLLKKKKKKKLRIKV